MILNILATSAKWIYAKANNSLENLPSKLNFPSAQTRKIVAQILSDFFSVNNWIPAAHVCQCNTYWQARFEVWVDPERPSVELFLVLDRGICLFEEDLCQNEDQFFDTILILGEFESNDNAHWCQPDTETEHLFKLGHGFLAFRTVFDNQTDTNFLSPKGQRQQLLIFNRSPVKIISPWNNY